MPSHATPRPRRPRHHHRNFPPQSYSDLSYTDMQALAPLFRPAPEPHTSAYAAYEADVRSRIVDLPSHLRRKPDAPTTFCRRHRNLSPMPIESILGTLQHVVRPEKLRPYTYSDRSLHLLFDMVATWGEHSEYDDMRPSFDIRYGRISANFVEEDDDAECAACKLISVADDAEGLAVLGALAIAHIEPKNWKLSKRVQIVELWYATVVDPEGLLEDVVRPMWDVAIDLYRHRPEQPESAAPVVPERAHVAAAIEAATARRSEVASYRTPIARPPPCTLSDVRTTATPSTRHFQTPNAPRQTDRYSQMDGWQSFASPSSPSNAEGQAQQAQNYGLRYVPSSLYSYGQSEYVDEWDSRASTESQIIDSYRRPRPRQQ